MTGFSDRAFSLADLQGVAAPEALPPGALADVDDALRLDAEIDAVLSEIDAVLNEQSHEAPSRLPYRPAKCHSEHRESNQGADQ